MAVLMTTSTYAATFQMTAPNGGESWPLDTTRLITWSPGNVSGNVRLDLYKGGTALANKVGTITTNTPAATGKYSWHVGKYIGGTAIAGEGYLVVISSNTPEMKDSSNGPFTITSGTLQTSHAKATKGLPLTNLGPQAAARRPWKNSPSTGRQPTTPFFRGGTLRIIWNTPTPLGGSVRITLLDPGETIVQTIAPSAENKGGYDWVIPKNTPEGSYCIKVQILNSDVSNKSGIFKIAKKPMIAPGAFKIFRVLSPIQNQVIKPPNDPIHIIWETEYLGPFTGDICKKNSVGHWVSVRQPFLAQSFNPVSSSGGLNRYIADVYVNSPDPATPDGWYKVKVSVGDGGLGVFSEAFRIERGTAKKQVILEAVEIVDRYAEKMEHTNTDYEPIQSAPAPEFNSRPGLSRVGFRYYKYTEHFATFKTLYIFRSKVRFDLVPYMPTAPARPKIVKATLRLVTQDSSITTNFNQCGGKLLFLIQPWNVNQGSALDASGVNLATIPNQSECTIDVTQSVSKQPRSRAAGHLKY